MINNNVNKSITNKMRKSSGSCLVIAGAKFRTMASSDLPHQSTSPIRCAPGWLCEISFISSSWRASIGAVGGSAAVGWSSSVDAVDDAGADAATAGCADVAGTAQQRSPQPAVDVMMEPRRQRVWLERPDRGCVCLTPTSSSVRRVKIEPILPKTRLCFTNFPP